MVGGLKAYQSNVWELQRLTARSDPVLHIPLLQQHSSAVNILTLRAAHDLLVE